MVTLLKIVQNTNKMNQFVIIVMKQAILQKIVLMNRLNRKDKLNVIIAEKLVICKKIVLMSLLNKKDKFNAIIVEKLDI